MSTSYNQHNTKQHNTKNTNTTTQHTTQHKTTKHNTTYNTTQNNKAQHNTQHNTTQNKTTKHNTIRNFILMIHISKGNFKIFYNYWKYSKFLTVIFLEVWPNPGQGLLVLEVSRSHTTVGRTPLDEGSTRRRDAGQHTTLCYIQLLCVIYRCNLLTYLLHGAESFLRS